MDHHSINGHASLFLGLFLSFITWVSNFFSWASQNEEVIVRAITALGAIISFIYAVRHHNLGARYKKLQIKKLEQDLKGKDEEDVQEEE